MMNISALDISAGIDLGNNMLIHKTFQEYSLYNDFQEMDSVLMNHFTSSLFFDIGYLNAEMGFDTLWGGQIYHKQINLDSKDQDIEISLLRDRYSYFTLGLQGKYPFDTSVARVYPLLGIKYMLNLTAENGDGMDLKEAMTEEERNNLNRFILQVGGGMDRNLSDSWYLRGSFLIGYLFLSPLEKQEIDDIESTFIEKYRIQNWNLEAKAGLGYRF